MRRLSLRVDGMYNGSVFVTPKEVEFGVRLRECGVSGEDVKSWLEHCSRAGADEFYRRRIKHDESLESSMQKAKDAVIRTALQAQLKGEADSAHDDQAACLTGVVQALQAYAH